MEDKEETMYQVAFKVSATSLTDAVARIRKGEGVDMSGMPFRPAPLQLPPQISSQAPPSLTLSTKPNVPPGTK